MKKCPFNHDGLRISKHPDPLSKIKNLQPRPHGEETSSIIGHRIASQIDQTLDGNLEPVEGSKILEYLQVLVNIDGLELAEKIKQLEEASAYIVSITKERPNIMIDGYFQTLVTYSLYELMSLAIPDQDNKQNEIIVQAAGDIMDQLQANLKGFAYALIAEFKDFSSDSLAADFADIRIYSDISPLEKINVLFKKTGISIGEHLNVFLSISSSGSDPRMTVLLESFAATLSTVDKIADKKRFKSITQFISPGFKTGLHTIWGFIRVAYQKAESAATNPSSDKEIKTQFVKTIHSPHFLAQILRLADLRQNTFVSLDRILCDLSGDAFEPDKFNYNSDTSNIDISEQSINQLIDRINQKPEAYSPPNPGCPGKQLVVFLAREFINLAHRSIAPEINLNNG